VGCKNTHDPGPAEWRDKETGHRLPENVFFVLVLVLKPAAAGLVIVIDCPPLLGPPDPGPSACGVRQRDRSEVARARSRSRFGFISGVRRKQSFTTEATLHHVCTPPALSEKHGETSFLGIGEPKVHPVFTLLDLSKKHGETLFQLRFRRVKSGIYAPASPTRSGRKLRFRTAARSDSGRWHGILCECR